MALVVAAAITTGAALAIQGAEQYPTRAVFTPEGSSCLNVIGAVETEYGWHHVNAGLMRADLPEVWSMRQPIGGVVVRDGADYRFRADDGTEFRISPDEWSETLDCPIG